MKKHALLITSGLLLAITGAAMADDHLFNAGVENDIGQKNNAPHLTGHFEGSTASFHSHATVTNKAGHSGDLATREVPSQASIWEHHRVRFTQIRQDPEGMQPQQPDTISRS